MGRGLSELQKTIMRLAIDHAATAPGYDIYANKVHISEIAEVYYGWKSTKKMTAYRERSRFDKKDIKGYNAGKVAIFKALHRLKARGLIRFYNHQGEYIATEKALAQDPRCQELIKIRHLGDILRGDEVIIKKGDIEEIQRYRAGYLLSMGLAEIVQPIG
jgi:hypothetical protein